jgi:hypothetical protein
MSFARFMAGPIGRGIRVLAGLVMIVAGLVIESAGGYVLAAVGLLPLLAGLLNVCLIAPILKAPLSGTTCLAQPR